MKSLLSLLAVGLVYGWMTCSAIQAQQPSPPVKYWIFLTDKADAISKTTGSQPAFLRAASLRRRARRGRPAPATLDAPLASTYLDVLRKQGIEPLVKSRWLNAVSAFLPSDATETVRALPFVREVRPVGQAVPLTESATPMASPPPVFPLAHPPTHLDYGASETQLALVNAIPPLERGINGQGVRLGFLDTEYGGFTHPAFARMVNEDRLLAAENFTRGAQSSRHGLNVASVAVGFDEGNLVGPAWGAEVLAATTEWSPSETNQEEDNFVAGLEWLEAQGADVVSISLNYTEFDAGEHSYTTDDLDGNTAVTTRAVDIAASLGVAVVVAAGNWACGSPDACWYFIGTPADADSAIAVGAVRADSSRVSFSSLGPTADGRRKPDVAAMGAGVAVASASGGYSTLSGTSLSAPMAAGIVCQMLQVNPNLTPVNVGNLLRQTASQAHDPDNALGWGIVNADAAVRAAETFAEETATEQPSAARFEVAGPYPTPAADHATIELRGPAPSSTVRLSVYNMLGQRVSVPFQGLLSSGRNRLTIDTNHLAPGLYVYTFEGENLLASGKLVVTR